MNAVPETPEACEEEIVLPLSERRYQVRRGPDGLLTLTYSHLRLPSSPRAEPLPALPISGHGIRSRRAGRFRLQHVFHVHGVSSSAVSVEAVRPLRRPRPVTVHQLSSGFWAAEVPGKFSLIRVRIGDSVTDLPYRLRRLRRWRPWWSIRAVRGRGTLG